MSETVWLVTAEVAMDGAFGFINVTLWASSSENAVERVESYLHTYDWQLLSISRVIEPDPERDQGDELNQMLEETLANRQFIRLGTYHTYPRN
ncbi:hypothetical protein [Occallatibacter riparius]|uniref:Uncharacterized protein n=1 Tax=Occallatibacter riparius TaxID=1002689 RepID=A0A9J7BHH0_9BACT|nr:hypothetical protein [Occallatibacter riparius]UWZ81961.1 hypothetical protein MOP44_15410 [Occallatibacter riparius]